MARPTKLTPELEQRILELLAGGDYEVVAASRAGIAPSTFHAWMARGRAERVRLGTPGTRARTAEAPYLEFLESVTHALAKAESANVAMVLEAAAGGAILETRTIERTEGEVTTTETYERRSPPDWRANAWWLERGPTGGRWIKRDRVELTGTEGGPVELTVNARDELFGKIAAMAANLSTPSFGPGTAPEDVEEPEAPDAGA